MEAKLIKVDRNGTKYFEGLTVCDRCGGEGFYIIGTCNGRPVLSPVDGGICFKCMGMGKVEGKWKEYTPEHEAKLQAKREARWQAKQKELEAEWQKAEAERKAKEEAERIAAEAKAAEEKARKAKSEHVGQVGGKIEADVVLEKKAWFDRPSFAGFGTEKMFIYTFRDTAGNAIVWKTAKGIIYEQGDALHIAGTVKEHSEYQDEKQTVILRCKITKTGAA